MMASSPEKVDKEPEPNDRRALVPSIRFSTLTVASLTLLTSSP